MQQKQKQNRDVNCSQRWLSSSTDPRRLMNIIKGANPLEIISHQQPKLPKNRRRNYVAKTTNTSLERQQQQLQYMLAEQTTPMAQRTLVYEQNNQKKYARNMRMLDDIRAKIDIEEVKSSPFEIETQVEREAAKQQIMKTHMKKYGIDADTSQVVQRIQKRAQTASKIGGTLNCNKRIMQQVRKTQPENEEPSICELFSAESVVKDSRNNFWQSARSSMHTFNTQQVRKVNVKDYTSSSAMGRFCETPAPSVRVSSTTSIVGNEIYNQNIRESRQQPLNSTKVANKLLKLSLSRNGHLGSGVTEDSRLYEKSKTIQCKLRLEKLRFLKQMDKELN